MNFNNCNFNVAVLGLDNAGKTTTILRLQGDESKPNRAQWGFNTTTAVFKYTKLSKFACISYMKQKKACLTFFDVGGHVKFRKVWPSYYMDVFGCIFVVDVNCKSRFDECKASFQEMAKNPMMKGKPIL
ncbi:P-loop containing nucleoside triphosphate hydrolase protein, partial [Globomyces pollinis-pini]